MPRLVTFGCSLVYGYGLPDCQKAPIIGGEPSKFAWPSLLANKIGLECLNLSLPGIGNFEILMKILDTKFLEDDLVIIGWSFFSRYDNYQILDNQGNGKRVSNYIISQLVKINENYLKTNYWDNWLCIQHAELFLSTKKVKNFSYLGFGKSSKTVQDFIRPELITVKNLLDIDLVRVDLALDKQHPGTKSHELQFENIYDKIKNELR